MDDSNLTPQPKQIGTSRKPEISFLEPNSKKIWRDESIWNKCNTQDEQRKREGNSRDHTGLKEGDIKTKIQNVHGS